MQAEAVCYFCHASICVFVPYIVAKLGSRMALFLGSTGYLVFTLGAVSLSYSEKWGSSLLYLCASFKGFMSPIL